MLRVILLNDVAPLSQLCVKIKNAKLSLMTIDAFTVVLVSLRLASLCLGVILLSFISTRRKFSSHQTTTVTKACQFSCNQSHDKVYLTQIMILRSLQIVLPSSTKRGTTLAYLSVSDKEKKFITLNEGCQDP